MRIDDEDEDLRRMLAEPGPPIADDGFTERVMARLPPSPRLRRRPLVLGISTLLTAVVLWFSPATTYFGEAVARAASAGLSSLPISIYLAATALIAAMICAGAYASSPD